VAADGDRGGEPFLHPGRSAQVTVAGRPAGWLGELGPAVVRQWDLDRAAGWEVDLDAVAAAVPALITYHDVAPFPAVRQDIAVIVSEAVAAARVEEVVRTAGGDLLDRVTIFDRYRGPQVGEGRVSLALALEFRAPDRTLTEDEASQRREAIAAALAKELGGELRA
jgi:phenylalanyl-tRNA synthetase beta chain